MATKSKLVPSNLIFSNIDVNTSCPDILKPLDELLRCRICFDYFTDCMMTKCSHSYCSVCIRRYMVYKSQCPTCFQMASEPELRNNRLIDEILTIYKLIRETIESEMKKQIMAPVGVKTEPESELTKQSYVITHPVVVKTEPGTEMTEQSNTLPMVVKTEPISPLPVVPMEKSISETNPTTENVAKTQPSITQENNDAETVYCPVCYCKTTLDRINSHLDKCLQQQERNKFMPKVVYHLLSDKQIRKMLKENGLNTSGERQALMRRHRNFRILYNANCDSQNPRPISEIIREIEVQEIEERVLASQKVQQVDKKSDPIVIKKQHELYIDKHKDQFNSLIKDVQERMQSQSTKFGNPSSNLKVERRCSDEDECSADESTLTMEENLDESKGSISGHSSFSGASLRNITQDCLDPNLSSSSSLEDFQITKMNISRLQKKSKRRLSKEESFSQRKK